jgi:putative copper export protein/mono/diheme cytochrome c family protein
MVSFLIAARAVHYASIISLAGVFAFLCFVVGPVISPPLHARLSRVAWASLAFAVLSGGGWLLLVSAQMSSQTIADTLSQGVVATVLTRTRFGQVWILRFALAVILAGLLLLPQGYRGRWWRWGGLAFAAGTLAALAWAGHGAATPGRPGDLHLAADILHLLAAGAWVGSLIPLALMLAEMRQNGDPGSAVAARRVVVRFSVLAAVSVVILLAAGLVNTWFLAGTIPVLIGTEYGRLLLCKIAIFVTMVTFGAVNLLRMTPRLGPTTGHRLPLVQAALGHLRRNALVEAGLGLSILGIVAVLGILPPGLHTEPGWPLPFRLELAALGSPSAVALAILTTLAAIFLVVGVAAAAAGRYRTMTGALGGFTICAALGALAVRPAIEPAYPTSFYAPAKPYVAASIEHGARLYAGNCALCHGAGGKGDGPAAAALTVRPADLTGPHLFAHTEGDLFWWVSHGKADGVMPGFASVMSPADRWDVINFIRARAAGILSRGVGPVVSAVAAPAVPDFAFQNGGRQQTLGRILQDGPALVALFSRPPVSGRVAQLAAAQKRLRATGLNILAIDLGSASGAPAETAASPPLVGVAADVAAALVLFRAPDDGGETDLILDRAANVRARWTAATGRLPDAATLLADAARVARFPAPPQNHAGHVH